MSALHEKKCYVPLIKCAFDGWVSSHTLNVKERQVENYADVIILFSKSNSFENLSPVTNSLIDLISRWPRLSKT